MAGNPVLVDPAVSAAKLDSELAAWRQNDESYSQRGWLMLGREELNVELALMAKVPLANNVLVPAITACLRLNFDNYDIWPASVTFIDFFSRDPSPPPVGAWTWQDDGTQASAVIGPHPKTGMPFLCLPGVREYHSHHEHNGDDWLLHRSQGRGTLAAICEEVWQRMARNVVGVRLEAQSLELPAAPSGRAQAFQVSLVQAPVDRVEVIHQPDSANAPAPPQS